MLRQQGDSSLERIAQGICEWLLLEIDDILQNIIAERILNKLESAICDLTDELSFLRACGMVDATLKDTAAVAMSPNGNAICPNRVKNEL